MIFAAFINNSLLYLKKPSNCFKAILIICIFLFFLISRFYNIDSRFGFDHDQEKAAESAWNLIKDHRLSLIGIEASRGGIFAGPLLNWTHAVFLLIWNFDPIALAYQAILANLLLLVIIFDFIRNISDSTQATIATFIYALSPRMVSYDISASPISYMSLHTMLVIYLYYKVVYEKKKYLLGILGLIIGLGYHIHLFLLFSIIPVAFLFWKHKIFKAKQKFIQLLAFFSLPLLSALLFELRHDFLMTKNILSLIQENSQYNLLQIIQIPKTLISLLADSIIQTNWSGPLLFVPILILWKHLTFEQNQNICKDLVIFTIFPCIPLFFYKGPTTEYYLVAAVVPFILFSSYRFLSVLKYNKYFFLIICLSIIFINTSTIIAKSKNPHSLRVKKQMFEHILATSNSKEVSIKYSMPQEYNYGFTYLAKWYKIIENSDAKYKFLVQHDEKPYIYKENQYYKSKTFGFFQLTQIN